MRPWIAGAGACVIAMAMAAVTLVDIGSQGPQAAKRGAVATQPAPAPLPPPRATPESEIITEFREPAPVPSASSWGVPGAYVPFKPPWAAKAAQPSFGARRAASAPVIATAPAEPAPVVREAPPVRAAPSAPAPRPGPADQCQDASGIAQSICLARQCSNPAVRGHRQCAQVRETEQRIRERMEQGG